MADDIVTRLRTTWQHDQFCDPEYTQRMADDAADEIERLRAERHSLSQQLDLLRGQQ